MKVTIYHNPACGTSRNVLGYLREMGIEPEVIEYLKTPPSIADLSALIRRMGISVREAVRQNVSPYTDLGLDNLDIKDNDVLAAMVAHPILINRPIVVTPHAAGLCRPAETVKELLEKR